MADDDVAADLLDAALETAKKEDAPAEPKEPKDSDKDKDKKEEPRDRSRSRSRSKSRRSRSRDRFGRIKRDRSRSRGGGRSRGRDKGGRRSHGRRGRSHRYRGRRRRTSSSRGKRRGRDRDRDREREREKERRGKKEGSSSPSRPRQRSAISPESMPKLAEPPASSPKDVPPGGEEGDDKKKKKSKWDDMGDPSGLPDWLKDLKEEQGKPTPPGMDPARFKIIRMEGVQIRALIGKGGETIKEIRLRSGADIKIDHLPSDPEGNVTIVGDVEKTEGMIKEVLSTKGCPLVPKPQARQVPPPPPPDGLGGAPGMPGMPGMPPPLEANENEVIVPGDIVGHLIGPSGANIKEIREKAGGQVFISILPPSTPGADQLVRVAGDHREYAKQLLLEKIEELKAQYRPMGGLAMNQPGYPGAMGMPGMAGGGTVPSIPGRSKAVGMVPPQPMMSPALPVPNMPLRPAPGPQGAYPGAPSGPSFVPRPGGMAAPGGYGCYGGGPEMDSLRPSLGGCGLPAMGSTTGPSCMGGPNSGGYMGGCGMSGGCMGAPMAPPPPGGCGLGSSGGMGCPMGMGGMSPGPCGMRGPGPPGPPMGAPSAMAPAGGLGGCHVGPPTPAPQPTFPPLAPPCMAPAASPPSSLPLNAPRAPSPPVPAPKAEPPGQSDSQDFNAILREAAKAAEATIGMSNTPKPSTPSAGVPLL